MTLSLHQYAGITRKISNYIENYDENPKPFAWTAKANGTLAKDVDGAIHG